MRAPRRVGWEELTKLAGQLTEQARLLAKDYRIDSLYPIPSGGASIAAMMAGPLGLPLVDAPSVRTLIVDDICDSGRTLAQWPEHPSAVVFCRPVVPQVPTIVQEWTEDWIVFPYEHGDSGDEVVTRMLERIGEDPKREGLRDTPQRVIRSWSELFAGYTMEPRLTTFEDTCDEMVVSQNIRFISFCEHHLLPFYGRAHVAYLPDGRLVGISKLTRLVEKYARRLQLQERLTQQVAGELMETLKPLGVGVVVEATHFCMMARGVRQHESLMTTSAMLGRFRDAAARAEFLGLLNRRR